MGRTVDCLALTWWAQVTTRLSWAVRMTLLYLPMISAQRCQRAGSPGRLANCKSMTLSQDETGAMETKAKPLSWCRSCSLKVKVSGMQGGGGPAPAPAAARKPGLRHWGGCAFVR